MINKQPRRFNTWLFFDHDGTVAWIVALIRLSDCRIDRTIHKVYITFQISRGVFLGLSAIFSHFVKRRWRIHDSSSLGRCYLVLSASSSYKGAAPKLLWEKVISRLAKKALDNIDLNQMSHRYVSGALQNDWSDLLDFHSLDRSQRGCCIWVSLSYKMVNIVVSSLFT